MKEIKSEIWVGMFVLLALLSSVFICLQTADLTFIRVEPTYRIYATFDNISGLKVSSPVRIGGVVVGKVAGITLNTSTYLPCIALDIKKRYDHIPDTSSLSIRTSGLLGEKYVELNIGFKDLSSTISSLKEGDVIQDTKSAIVLEDMIGHFLYNAKFSNDVIK